MVFQVVRQEHRRHAPPTQLTLDRVAVSESLTQGVEQIGHGTWGLAYHALQPPASVAAPAAFLAIAVAGLAERVAIWRSARRTQADMIELSQRLEQLARVSPSPALEPEIVAMRELAAEVGDNAIQAAAQTTVIFVIVLVALGVGLWYNRRRLATPFAHVVGALQRVAAGWYA